MVEQSPRRDAALGVLRAAESPLGIVEIASRSGLHPNTVRFHLDALTSQGLVERSQEKPSGRGRPRTVYVVRPGMNRGGRRDYRLLAEILLGRLAATEGGSGAEDTGRAWGRQLIEHVPPLRRTSRAEAIRRLTAMMSDLGFAPEYSGDTPGQVRLRHCPFLELAEDYSSTLCPLHLGLMRGALAEIRAPIEATRLEPFAEPDACLVHLESKSRRG
ncbi:helix-turn-helix transcriptional regulator [Kribbella swartbergensis]